MELAKNTRRYYLDHFDEMPFDKQFHFAGRLSSWTQDTDCMKLLEGMQGSLLPQNTLPKAMLQDIMQNLPKVRMNASGQRAPYFEKYPQLRGLMLALFRVRHLLFVYDTDVRSSLLELVSYDEMHALGMQLAADHDALRVLSTYAINYMYLLDDILYEHGQSTIDVDVIYSLGDGYDTSKADDILLLIYLYTHCIIADSNFYQRAVNPDRKPTYQRMLERLEQLIADNFEDINLDNKLEFLVCSRICGITSSLAGRIYEECERSVSPEGTFLIDTINHAKQSKKKSFADSEHRNVLFIMSTSPYRFA